MRVTLHLVFVLHQPVGTRDSVMAELADDVYDPLIDLLEAFDDEIRCGLHCSGYVLEWLDRHRRVLTDRIATLASNGVVEMLGGGFYAPLLPIVPWRDGLGQLEMAAGYLERRMGVRPDGVWLTDGVWEPRMAELLADAGAAWTMVDEAVIADAGVPAPIRGHYTTEHLGRPLSVLPIDARLRQRLPRKNAEKTVRTLHQRRVEAGKDITLTWCGSPTEFPTGRLSALFEAMALSHSWLTIQHPSTSIERQRTQQMVYMRPTTALGRPLAQHHFVRYAEAAWLHKRMIDVSKRFAALERILRNQGAFGLSKLTHLRRNLFRGQAATVFEQGGQIYQPEVRDGVYRNLIACEAETQALIGGDEPFLETSLRDLFGDFETSVLLRNREVRLVLQPHAGGTLTAWEHTESHSALHNTMTRRKEPWHETLQSNSDLDGHTRAALHDRFLAPGTRAATWMNDEAELGNFLHARYRMAGLDQVGRGPEERVVVAMAHDGEVTYAGETVPVTVIKKVGLSARDSHATVEYEVELTRPFSADVDFGCELNWATMHWLGDVGVSIDAVAKASRDPRSSARSKGERIAAMLHQGLGIWVFAQSDQPMRIERAPILTKSPVAGRPATLQGISLLLRRRIRAGKTRLKWSLRLGVKALDQETDAAS